MKRLKIELGSKYGKLTIVEEVEPNIQPSGQTKRKFKCVCDCGNEKYVILDKLKSSYTSSCGCNRKKNSTSYIDIHGLSKSITYKSWESMKARCYNPNNKNYKDYGGRGIKVCDRWKNSFINFYSDMGERPEGTSIDRINVNGDYEPSNCRWATKKEQAINRRTTKNYKNVE